jgi:isopentenyldiphosphate isomerase
MHTCKGNTEILEVWDWENGLPTGESIGRDEAHLNGTPHEAVHLWILRTAGGRPGLLFQLRAPHKQNYPDCLDITVGGHVPYGIGGSKIVKEAREELGFDPDPQGLIDLGWYRYEEKNDGLFQRELQHIYMINDNRGLDAYRFMDGEVTGIFEAPLDDVLKILAGGGPVEVHGFTGSAMIVKTVGRGDFHPQLFHQSMETYMRVVLQASGELASSGRVTARMPDI